MSKCTGLKTIGDYAFFSAYYNYESCINLSACKNLETIGNFAFACNGFKEVNLSSCENLTTIKESSFSNCYLEELNMSGCTSLTTIGDNTFFSTYLYSLDVSGCTSLTTIGDNAFYASKLEYLDLSDNKSLTTIGDYAFFASNLEYLDLSDNKSLTTIGDYAFSNSRIKTLILGEGITNIGVLAFNYSYLESIDLSLCKNLTTINDKNSSHFVGCSYLKYIALGEGITYIDENAFRYYSSLTNVDMSACVNLETIGDFAFASTGIQELDMSGCTSLTNIGCCAFSNTYLERLDLSACTNLTYIGDSAFSGVNLQCLDLSGCKNLTTIDGYAFAYNNLQEVDLSACTSLTTIGYNAFIGNNLHKIIFNEALEHIWENAFSYNPLIEVDMSMCKNLKEVDPLVFSNCEQLTKIIFGSGLTGFSNFGQFVYDSGFKYLTSLKEIDMSACTQLTQIDNDLFVDCVNLSKVTFGKGLQFIGERAFCDNTSLVEVDLSATNISTIGDFAFYGCSSLSTLKLNDNLETIGTGAFFGCSSLKNVTIGNYCRNIAANAFDGCTELESIEISEDNQSYCISDDGVLIDEQMSLILKCPEGKKGSYIIPDNITYIDYAFENCNKLTEITIGSACQDLYKSQFASCKSLENINVSKDNPNYTSVDGVLLSKDKTKLIAFPVGKKGAYTLPDSVTEIDNYVFNDCNKLTEILIYSKNLSKIGIASLPSSETCTIYCYKNSQTHKTLETYGYTNLTFFTSEIYQTDITVNGTSVDSFSTETKDYIAYVDDITDVTVLPVFEESDANYTVTSENNVYTINIYDENDELKDTYKVTVKEHIYTVTGDITLTLNPVSTTKVGGSIVLPAGIYKLKIAKGSHQFGYNKTVSDYCNGLSLSEKYISYITLNATGGTYTFQYDTSTNKLVIKYDSNMPNEYLVGDLDTILKPVAGKTLAIGSQNLDAGTYKFSLSIGGTEYGYNATVNDETTGSLSLSEKYTSQITLNVTGGMYTFVLNTSTNRLEIRYTPTVDENKDDVHISGGFDLVLNDKADDGSDLTTAIGITTLSEGTYTFKVHNYGIVYTAGAVINDKATKNLSNKYTTPVTLNANGGTYKFVFNKETGSLTVSKVG